MAQSDAGERWVPVEAGRKASCRRAHMVLLQREGGGGLRTSQRPHWADGGGMGDQGGLSLAGRLSAPWSWECEARGP